MTARLREFLKAAARVAASIAASPALLSFAFGRFLLGRDRALQNTSQGLALVPGLAGQYLRVAFLRYALDHCHPTATIEFGTTFSKVGARIGKGVYIGPMCHIGLAHIEEDVLLAAGVHVPSGGRLHGMADPRVAIRDQPGVATVVTIGAGSWVGCGAIVMADVGRGTVVGAGSVVTRPLPNQVVATGVPARVRKTRAEDPSDCCPPGISGRAGELDVDGTPFRNKT